MLLRRWKEEKKCWFCIADLHGDRDEPGGDLRVFKAGRRDRLENELAEAQDQEASNSGFAETKYTDDMLVNIDEYDQEEIDEFGDFVATGATTAETIEQLILEVAALRGLEQMAFGVLQSGQDTAAATRPHS